jgi:hypothetical protein
MSKNLTRKGLALGAIVALGSTVFAGSPALAIDPVSLAPTTGTGYTTILGETFSLSSQFTDAAQLAGESLKWIVTDSSAKLDLAAVGVSLDGTSNYVNATGVARNASKQFVISGGANFTTDSIKLQAESTNTTDAFDVTVQAWLDYDNDGVIDTGANAETTSVAQTVKFVTAANSGIAATLGAITLDDTTIGATVAFGADVNLAQLTNTKYEVAFGKLASGVPAAIGNGTTAWVSNSAPTRGQVITWDATDKVYKQEGTVTIAAGAGIYVAQTLINVGGTWKVLGSPSYKTAGAAVAITVPEVGATNSADVKGATNAYIVRTGTKTVSVASNVIKKADGDDVDVLDDIAAGLTGTVTVTGTNLATTTTITVGSKTLTSTTATGKVSFEATTNADGKFVFDIASSTGKVGDILNVKIKVAGKADNNTSFTWTDAAAASITDLVVGTSAVRNVVKGDTVSIDYVLKDNFDSLISAEGYRVAVNVPNATYAADGTTAADVNKFVSFVAGKATVTYVAAKTGDFTATAGVQKADATSGNFGANLYTATSDVRVHATAQVAAKVTASAGTNTALETKTFVTGDKRVLTYGLTVPTWSVTANNEISGDVTDALGAPVYGAPVTVAAAGVLFQVGTGATAVYAKDSITLNTTTAGHYSVFVYSGKSGKTTFTITSGAASKTVDVTFAGAVASALKNTVVTLASTSQAGRSLDVTAVATDAAGNPVEGVVVSFSVTGVGSLSNSGTATTDAKGVATVKLTSSYGEFGDAAVTVSHKGADGVSVTAAEKADDFTVVKTVSFGVTDASIDLLGKRVIVTAEFAKGKKVTVYDNGVRKYSAIQTSDAERIIAWNVKKGSHNIVVKISGGYSDNLVLSVK